MTPRVVWLVTLQDKDLEGEPDIGMAIVSDVHVHFAELRAQTVGRNMEAEMRAVGRCRCVATVRPINNNQIYAIDALISRTRAR